LSIRADSVNLKALQTNRLRRKARMNIHKNARSCPASRALLIERIEKQGWSLAEAAAAIGLSPRRAGEYRRRSRNGEPLTDRSSRPRRIQRLAEETREQVMALRRERHSLVAIAARVGISLSSVARICREHGLKSSRAD
jgi:transposase